MEENNSNDMPQKRKMQRYNVDFPLPDIRSNFERDMKVLKALVIASKKGSVFVGRKEVAQIVGIHEQIVGGILTFFLKIEFAEKEGNKYKPTKEIIEFSKFLDFGDRENAGEKIKPILLRTWFGEKIKELFELEGKNLKKEEVFNYLGRVSGAINYHKPSLNQLLEYLEFGKIIVYDDEKETYSFSGDIAEKVQVEKKETSYEQKKEFSTSEEILIKIYSHKGEDILKGEGKKDIKKIKERFEKVLTMIEEFWPEKKLDNNANEKSEGEDLGNNSEE